MKYYFFTSIALLLLQLDFTIAQTDSINIPDVYVKRILISGNEKTNEQVIMRELSTKEGELLDIRKLESDVNRLYNLGLFTKIEVQPVPVSIDSIIILFDFSESFYLLPIPQGGIKENSFKKLWGGLNIVHNNFRGMNEKFGLSFGIGYDPFVKAYYKNPWIGDSSRYSFEVSIGYSRTNKRYIDSVAEIKESKIEDLPLYKLDQFQSDLSISRYFSKNLSVSFGAGFFVYNTGISGIAGLTGSADGKDRFVNLNGSVNYDTRDIQNYPNQGALYNLKIVKYGLFTKSVDFVRINSEYKRYFQLPLFSEFNVNWAWKFSSSVSFGGSIPEYLKLDLGQSEEIRGWKDLYFSEESRLVMSSELRFPIVKPSYIDGNKLPVIRNLPVLKDFSYRYGLFFTLFFDSGTVWSRGTKISDFVFRNGYGLGLNVILPFNFIGRIDFGWRNKSNANIFLSLDAAF